MDAFDSAVQARGSFAKSLQLARERGFVGRIAELAAFADSLDGVSETRVHFVHGAGGIGKTTLLEAMTRQALLRGRQCFHLDGREILCSASAVLAGLAERPGQGGSGTSDAAEVLFIDGYELLEPLDRWFREDLFPSRPAGSVIAIASRNAPPPQWRIDSGWRGLVQVHELGPLDPADSLELLARLKVAPEARGVLARLAQGYPLVLAMLSDTKQSGALPVRLSDVPDLVSRLCRIIIDDIPDDEHRTALATCAHATWMTEDLLRRTVGPRVAGVWEWLQARPYVSSGTTGLFLHDVVRELFEAEFLQRSPDDYCALHRTIRGYFLEKLVDATQPDTDRAAAELLLLHRKGPLSEQTAALRGAGLPRIERARRQDHERILEIIEQGEGIEAAELARQWIETQPDGLYRVRSDEGVEGFSLQVYLPETTGIGERDPVTRAIVGVVAEHGALRPGERINVNRFAGATGAYQRDPLQLLVNGVSCILEWSSQPAAWTFIVTFDPEYYGPYFEYLGFSPLVSVHLGGRDWAGYGWDRRRFPPPDFFELMARRELSGETGPPPADLLRPAPLGQREFNDAVRAALSDYRRPDRLATSPLLQTRLVDPTADQPVEALRQTLLAAIRLAATDRRGRESGRVLERTYVKGAPSQEAAAELLGLPFGTYRRHLAQALERVCDALWSMEIGVRPLADLQVTMPQSGREVDRE